MTVLEIITAAGRRTNKQTGNADVKLRFIDHLNFARKKAWNRFNWSWKNKTWQFTVSDQIASGTAAVVNGAWTVVISGPSISSAQVGWYFQVPSVTPPSFYHVVAVTGSTLTINPAYQGASNGAVAYYLRGFDWLLPSELEGMPLLTELGTSEIPLQSILTRPTKIPDARGQPRRGVIWSDDPIGTTVSAGTVSGTTGTRALTGSGTAWVSSNVTPGDQVEIVVGSTTYKYHVQSVQSDSAITLYQYLQTSPSASTYTIRNQFARYVRLYPTPDNPYVMAIYGQRRWYPVSHDNDIDELMQNFDESLVEGLEAYEAASTPDDREKDKYNRWLIGLNEKIGVDSRNFNVVNPAPIALPYGRYRA